MHDVYMGKGPTRKSPPGSRLRPRYQRTFIKQWRVYRAMSQEELADMVGAYLQERGIRENGYTHASIGRIENGLIPYSQPIMEAISQALRVPVATLISRPPPNPGEEEPPDPEDLERFWREFSRITKRQ